MRARPKYYQRKHILLRQLDLEKAFYKNKITFKDNLIMAHNTYKRSKQFFVEKYLFVINSFMVYLKKIILKVLDYFNYIVINKKSYYSFKTAHNKNFKRFEHIYEKFIDIEKPIIFDVGASWGQSIKFFKKFYPQSIIYSFEPVSDCCKMMESEFSKDDDINIYNFAVGNKNEKKIFNVYENAANSSFFEKDQDSAWYKKTNEDYIKERNPLKLNEKKEEVEVITLDSFCKKNHIDNIDLLKIDAQSYEEFVLEGSQNLLKENKIKRLKIKRTFSDKYSKKTNNFFDIEKHLHNNNYVLIGISNFGSTIENANFYCDVFYALKDLNFK